MRTFAQKPKAPQQTTSAKYSEPRRAFVRQSAEVSSILHLQRTIGNHAVQRLLQTHTEEVSAGLTGTASRRFGHDFSRIPLRPPTEGAIQPKLAINTTGDEYEEEADCVAEQVIRMPEPQLQRTCACGGECPKCQTKQPSQNHARLETQGVRASDAGQIAAPPIVYEVLATPGRSLDSGTRGFMEPRFGYDLSGVRVHTDARADTASAAVGARAFTVGADVVFRRGEFAPHTNFGRTLLAHELTHVVQQGAADGLIGPHEEVGGAAARRAQVSGLGTAHRAVIQRDQYDYTYPGGIPPRRSRFELTRDACRNRANWSDGGHWIGTGPEPDCSMRGTARQTSTITMSWPTEESVIRAREQINRSRNITGYIVGGLVTIASAGAEAPLWVALLAGTGGSVLTDYLPSVIDMVRSGDRLTIGLEVAATRSAHPWGRNAFTSSSTWELVNRDGDLKYGASYSHTIQASDLTEAQFDRLFTALGGQ